MDRLSANIENQTEMLQKVCKFLAARQDIEMPVSHPAVLDVKLWEGIADSYAGGCYTSQCPRNMFGALEMIAEVPH